jgi:probable F420-dependent oxidoreductase
MRPIKFNVGLPNGDPAATIATARRAEDLGYYSVSIDDHFFMRGLMAEPHAPHYECFTMLSAVAATTKTIRMLPLVTSMSYRDPALLAKTMASIDNLSGGRFIAGLGAGWFREEYDAYGFPYPSNAERIEQMGDGIKLLKAMWTQDEPTYHGRYFKIDKAICDPKPVQRPLPILIGGGGKRILEIAAQEADVLNLNPPVTKGYVDIVEALKFDRATVLKRLELIRGFLKAAGRAPDALELSGGGFVLMAKDRGTTDAMAAAMAQTLKIEDNASVRDSLQVLIGTPDDIKRELTNRIEKFGMTYFFLNFMMPDAAEMFAKEVMPAFAR